MSKTVLPRDVDCRSRFCPSFEVHNASRKGLFLRKLLSPDSVDSRSETEAVQHGRIGMSTTGRKPLQEERPTESLKHLEERSEFLLKTPSGNPSLCLDCNRIDTTKIFNSAYHVKDRTGFFVTNLGEDCRELELIPALCVNCFDAYFLPLSIAPLWTQPAMN